MTDQLTDEEFIGKARELLNESAEHLDAATLSKLHQARSHALESSSAGLPWYGWASGSAIAAGLLLGVFVYQQPTELPAYPDPITQEIAENMELLEDMEFMAWMILQEEEASDSDAAASS